MSEEAASSVVASPVGSKGVINFIAQNSTTHSSADCKGGKNLKQTLGVIRGDGVSLRGIKNGVEMLGLAVLI